MSSLGHLAYLAWLGCVALAAAGACWRTAEASVSSLGGLSLRHLFSVELQQGCEYRWCVVKYLIPKKCINLEGIDCSSPTLNWDQIPAESLSLFGVPQKCREHTEACWYYNISGVHSVGFSEVLNIVSLSAAPWPHWKQNPCSAKALRIPTREIHSLR